MSPPAIVGFLLLAACVTNPAPSTTVPTGLTMTVDSVADGDSFRADDLEVRLQGVNAPEQDECFGDEARKWLEDAIGGQSVRLDIVDIDQFDRSLADAFHGTSWINRELVASGHALALSSSADPIQSAEEEARSGVLGMWGTQICGATAPVARLAIIGVEFNPPGDDRDERITIRNLEQDDFDLTGFILRDESSVNRLEFDEIVVPRDGRLEISTACNGNEDLVYWCTQGPVWNNDGDTALLLDSFGRIVSRYRYP